MAQQNLATTFGQYIDTLIRLYASVHSKGLTEYIKNDLSNDKNDASNRLSSRQIARMRDIGADEFPEGKGLLKLLEALPGELQVLNPADLCTRLLSPTEPYLHYQEELIEKYSDVSITIVSGRKPPLALTDSQIIAAMTKAIGKCTKYTFLYPHRSTYPQYVEQDPEVMTQSWGLAIKRRIVRHWEEMREREAIEKGLNDQSVIAAEILGLEQDLIEFRQKVEAQVKVIHSALETDFWFLLPSSYSVFYNIERLQKAEKIPCYGAFRVIGSPVIRASPGDFASQGLSQVHSSGWLRMEEASFQELAAAYETAIYGSDAQELLDNATMDESGLDKTRKRRSPKG